jgi:4-diphosphocytidyl-2-C-methyl-D-erythritol kinase
MSESLILDCPAKLNITLQVLGKKNDGMHEIKSHFQLINLFDEMQINKSKALCNSIRTNASIDIENDKNLVYQAIKALSKYVQQDIYCEVTIKKNIPIGGGLGGGSSNAAAALIGINHLYSLNLSISELMEIGLELGADVPFFIFGKNAIASGIGDKLHEIKCSKNNFLVLSPNIHSSTKDMFMKWDELNAQNALQPSMADENAFAQIFLDQHKEVRKFLQTSSGFSKFRLSGTGSTIFYMDLNPTELEKTLKKIPTKWRHFFCEPLQCSPLLKYIT